MKYTALFSMALLICVHTIESAIVVQGDDTAAPKAFTTDITTKAYDKKSGTFFVGLTSGTADNFYTISKATRPTFSTTPQFSAVLKDTDTQTSVLKSATIEFLACVPQASAPAALAVVAEGSTSKTANTVIGLLANGTETPATSALNDAGGTLASDGIVQLTASNNYIFAFLKPNESFFGEDNTGIALIGIGVTDTTITLDIKDAPAGISGNKATELQESSTELKGTSGGLDVIFTDTQAALHWDDTLDRLFIGVQIQSNATATDIAKAVVVARVDNGALTLQEITPDSAITGGGTDEIIVTLGAGIDLKPNHLRVMHASTGPDYLIVDCTITGTCNRVFALPLVNDTSTPTAATNGTLADKNSSLSSGKKFTIIASAPGDLPENNPVTDPEAVVGAGDLPITASDVISDMVVLGDAVYISINKAADTDNDTGIWSSHALFDDEGKILRWTPWTKRTIPLNAFPGIILPGGSTHNGAVKFFEIDGTTGNVWLVEGTTDKTVGVTSWSTGTLSTDLITKVSSALSSGCYSVLDLDQSTRGFLSTTAYRYALFGGVNKVAFARISAATDITSMSSPQTVITDFSSASNFLSTNLPDGAGCCHVLEYSRTSTTADNDSARENYNYFFAGTNNGLYVFTDSDSTGFNAIDLSTLNNIPYLGGSWQKITTLSGPIVDIKTSGAGNTLYVIMANSTATAPLQSTLYSIPFASTTTAMFAPSNIQTIAQTGVGIFLYIIQFYGVQIIATDNPRAANPENKEQLVLATNQGLFHSSATQAGSASVATATNQTIANWQLVQESTTKTTASTAYYGIAGSNTPIRHTTWPFSIKDENGFKTFDRGSIHQFSGNGDATGAAATFDAFFLPEQFNAQTTSTQFTTLYPIINLFSDGGRRFFVFNRVSDPPNQLKLGMIPFDITTWNIARPDIITHPTVASTDRFFWVQDIGASGLLLAGTEHGVIGLE